MAVLTMGLAVAFTLVQPPSTMQSKLRLPSSVANSSSRSPAASLPAFSPAETTESPQAVELDLPCEGTTSFGKSVAQVRLTGATCERGKSRRDITTVELLNDANGFSATVFYPNQKSFTTDYVALVEGSNLIKILITYSNGEREERSHTIVRE